jgi:hypothetical protein
MPLAKYADRQHTLYLPQADDLKRWKKLSKPYTLNKWIYLMVERAIEAQKGEKSLPSGLNDEQRQEISSLENLIIHLQNENLALEAHDRDKRHTYDSLDAPVVAMLREHRDEYITEQRFKKELCSNLRDADLIDRINHILYTLILLEDIGLVKKSARGWEWVP